MVTGQGERQCIVQHEAIAISVGKSAVGDGNIGGTGVDVVCPVTTSVAHDNIVQDAVDTGVGKAYGAPVPGSRLGGIAVAIGIATGAVILERGESDGVAGVGVGDERTIDI